MILMLNYKDKFNQEEKQELHSKQEITEEQKQAALVRAINAADKSELDNIFESLAANFYNRFYNNDNYSHSFKEDRKREALDYWEEQREEAREQALEELQEIKESYIFELPEVGELETTEAIEKNTEIQLLNRELNLIDDPVDLYFAARYYEDDEVLARPVDRLVKARLKEIDEKATIGQIDNERQPNLSELNQTENLIKMILGSKYGYGNIEEDGNPERWVTLQDAMVSGEFTDTPADVEDVFNIAE